MGNRILGDETVADGECTSLEQLFQASARVEGQLPARPASIVVGQLLGFAEPFLALVTYPGRADTALPARLAVELDQRHIGHEVLLHFENDDPEKPIVIARLRGPHAWPLIETPPQIQIEADGQRLCIDATDQITLRCGQASITLTRAGKVVIKGTYVVSESAGVNRIKGGSVQLN